MSDLSDYRLTLLRARQPALYRGVATDAPDALLCVSDATDPHSDDHVRLQHEYGIRTELSPEWSVQPLELLYHDDKLVLVLADPGGTLLREYCEAPLDIPRFLTLAVAIVSALESAHTQGFVHCDLSPDTILLLPGEREVRLTGFGCAIRRHADRRNQDIRRAYLGALEYMAPELCGRMNLEVDGRADLYSLGCLFYQMLTCEMPTHGVDRPAVAHAHQARKPAFPSELIGGIPRQIEAIVMKLLEKDIAERYQSTASLRADLYRCLDAVRRGETLTVFPLDLPATAGRQRRTQVLFGRDEELALLSACFERVTANAVGETVFVSGYSGAGKSSLVRYWSEHAGNAHLFVTGICEQINSAMPYAALVQILEQLVRPIVGASEDVFRAAQARLHDALGDDAQALWSVLPDLRVVLGKTSIPAEPLQTVDRPLFLRTTAALIDAFASPSTPLVLFFDDLQWADEGTLSALAYLSEQHASAHVLLVGAYRSNEITPAHPVAALVEPSRAHCTSIRLAPLGRADTARIVASTLGCTLQEASPFVDLVEEKTGGNPFFATQFSIELAQEGLVEFEHQTTLLVRDIDRIRAKDYTDNVIDLILRRLDRMPALTQSALRHFACLGTATPLALLSRATGLSESSLPTVLADATRNDLIYFSDDVCHFRHDRIRESAYASIPLNERGAVHLAIGRRLLDSVDNDEQCGEIFEIACQINLGSSNAGDVAERRRFATLNVIAGKRSREATAYTSALTYFVAAAGWLDDRTDTEAAQWIAFYRADCECLIGALSPARARIESLAALDITMPLRAEMTRLASSLYTAQSRPDLGMAAGIDYLHRLGLDIPLRPTNDQVNAAFAQLCDQIGERAIADLAQLPMIDDPLWHSAIDILADLIPPALFIDVNLLDLILIQVTSLSLERGLCDASAFGFVFLNFVFGIRFGDYARGYEFGKLAITVVDRYERSVYRSRIYMRFGSLVVPWTRHWREGLPYIEEAYKISSEVGSMVFNVSSARNVAGILMLAGAPLADVGREARKGLDISISSKFALYAGLLGEQIAFVEALQESGSARADDEDKAMNAGPSVAFTVWYCRLARRFMLDDIDGALEAEQRAADSLEAAKTILEVIDYHFFGALARAAACAGAPDTDARSIHSNALAKHCAELTSYAMHCPANFAGRRALVMARMAELSGNAAQAGQRYAEAIEHSQTHHFPHVGGIANELFAACCWANGEHARARRHLRDAIGAYTVWGAQAKVRRLQGHPALRPEYSAPSSFEDVVRSPLRQLDIEAVMRASHALAGEIRLDRLIETLVSTALEHAGARRCVLISASAGGMVVEAQASVHDQSTDIDMEKTPLSSGALALAIVQTVVRSERAIVLDDAASAGAFVNDPYVQRQRSRAIACSPLIKQGKLIAVLYLENDLAAGAFTDDKMSMLSVLGGQAAIALENARLYQDLIEENRRRAEAEEALRNALANLAQVTRLTTMGELVASIIHEVTQPVTAISTSASAALRFLGNEPDTPNLIEAKEMLRIVIDDGARAGQVIRGLRAMARKSEPSFERFELHQAIGEVLVLLRGQMNDFSVELDNHLHGESFVRGDRVQIQQVVLNLVVNAVEAMSGMKGQPRILTVSTEMIESSAVCVLVNDSGPGIAASVARRVFDPFVTTKGSGMGMGLSICRSIIEAHGGELSARAGAPCGTTFLFTLPFAAELV